MESLFEKINQSICPNCGNTSLVLITKQEKLIDYTNLLRNNDKETILNIFNNSEIINLSCTICKTVYKVIDWTNGLPVCLKEDNEAYQKFDRLYRIPKIYTF